MNHTPGPWEIGDKGKSGIRIMGAVGTLLYESVATTNTLIYPANASETEQANARLIASAPELLSALKKADYELTGYFNNLSKKVQERWKDTGFYSTMQEVKQAIAKAEGKE